MQIFAYSAQQQLFSRGTVLLMLQRSSSCRFLLTPPSNSCSPGKLFCLCYRGEVFADFCLLRPATVVLQGNCFAYASEVKFLQIFAYSAQQQLFSRGTVLLMLQRSSSCRFLLTPPSNSCSPGELFCLCFRGQVLADFCLLRPATVVLQGNCFAYATEAKFLQIFAYSAQQQLFSRRTVLLMLQRSSSCRFLLTPPSNSCSPGKLFCLCFRGQVLADFCLLRPATVVLQGNCFAYATEAKFLQIFAYSAQQQLFSRRTVLLMLQRSSSCRFLLTPPSNSCSPGELFCLCLRGQVSAIFFFTGDCTVPMIGRENLKTANYFGEKKQPSSCVFFLPSRVCKQKQKHNHFAQSFSQLLRQEKH